MHFIGNGVHLVLNAFFFSFYYFILIFAWGKKMISLQQFIPADTTNASEAMLILSGIFMLMTLIVFVLYGLLASKVSSIVQARKSLMKKIERSFALVFAGLAVKLAIPEK